MKDLKAQTSVEYLMLLGVVVAIALVGFYQYMPRTYNAAETFYNAQATTIMGPPPQDGESFPKN